MQFESKINFEKMLVKAQRFLVVFVNYFRANLMNENLYAFSYNRTLLDMDVNELMKIQNLRV